MSVSVKMHPEAYLKKLQTAKEESLTEVADIICEEAASLAPEKTGSLKASLHVEDSGKNAKLIGSGLPYAIYTELGTRKIQPRAYLRIPLINNISKLYYKLKERMV